MLVATITIRKKKKKRRRCFVRIKFAWKFHKNIALSEVNRLLRACKKYENTIPMDGAYSDAAQQLAQCGRSRQQFRTN